MVNHALVEINDDPVLITVPDGVDPFIYTNNEICKKLEPGVTCVIIATYKGDSYKSKVLVGHYVIKCGDKVVLDTIHPLREESQSEYYKRGYEKEAIEYEVLNHTQCNVITELYELTLLELNLISYYINFGGRRKDTSYLLFKMLSMRENGGSTGQVLNEYMKRKIVEDILHDFSKLIPEVLGKKKILNTYKHIYIDDATLDDYFKLIPIVEEYFQMKGEEHDHSKIPRSKLNMRSYTLEGEILGGVIKYVSIRFNGNTKMITISVYTEPLEQKTEMS